MKSKLVKPELPIADIVDPSKVPEPANSRPIIIKGSSNIQDNTLVTNSENSNDSGGESTISEEERRVAQASSHKIILQPLDDDLKTPDLKSQVKADEPITDPTFSPNVVEEVKQPNDLRPKEESSPSENSPSLGIQSETDIKTEPDLDQTESSTEDSTSASTNKTEDLDKTKDKDYLARKQLVGELINKGKYFLPINQVKSRKNKNLIIISSFLIFLLIIAWYDVALDSGLVKNSLNLPHTHFFSLHN